MGHVFRRDKEFHHIIIEGAIEGRNQEGRPRNSYVSQLKNDAYIIIIIIIIVLPIEYTTKVKSCALPVWNHSDWLIVTKHEGRQHYFNIASVRSRHQKRRPSICGHIILRHCMRLQILDFIMAVVNCT
jgi:hypothetical protein